MLTELLRREIEQSPLLRDRFVSAHLFGGAHIAAGGNEFEKISGCADATEVGCIIAYNTFHDDAPPVADSWFGRTWHHPSWSITSWEDLSWEKVVSAPSLCVNPKTFTSGFAGWAAGVTGAVYLIGVQGITVLVHLPLNNQLQNVRVDEMDSASLHEQRELFEARWTSFNVTRTVISCLVTVSLMFAVGMQGN